MMAVIENPDRIRTLSTESGFSPGPMERASRLGAVSASLARHLAVEGAAKISCQDGLIWVEELPS
jgi:hypothetical protein